MRPTLFVVFLFPACVYLYIFRLRECHSFDCGGIAPAFFLGAVGPNRARRLICDAQRSILCHSCRFYACTFYATEALFAERTFRFFVRYVQCMCQVQKRKKYVPGSNCFLFGLNQLTNQL